MCILKRWLFLGFASFCLLCASSLNAMKLSPDFTGSLTVEAMDEALAQKHYAALKKDLYAKIDNKVCNTMEWVSGHLDYDKNPETAYDPFLLYFTLRQGYLKITAPKYNVFLKELYQIYRAFFLFAIVVLADTYAGIRLGHPVESIKIYNFLMGKLGKLWLETFAQFFNPGLEFYKYKNGCDAEPEDIIKTLNSLIIKEFSDGRKCVQPKFLDSLRSGEWIVCTECGEDYYFCKDTITFQEPSAQLRKQYEDMTLVVRAAHEESTIKIMEVFGRLHGTTAEKALEFAKMKFEQVWQ